ncbi:hypothetical protein JCM3774_005190 [Rhodotorula dairenensis]
MARDEDVNQQVADLMRQLQEANAAKQAADAAKQAAEQALADKENVPANATFEQFIASMTQAFGAKAKEKDESNKGGYKIGMEAPEGYNEGGVLNFELISNGRGDVPVVDQLVRAVNAGMIPPVSTFTETFLHHMTIHTVPFVPPSSVSFGEKAKKECRVAWVPFREANHLIPLDRFLPAFLKMIATVKTVICTNETSQVEVQNDAATFVHELIEHLGSDGAWRIVREYALERIATWANGISAKVPWSKNRLAGWSDAAFLRARTAAGARADSIGAYRIQTGGDTATAWGTLTPLVFDKSKAETVKRIRVEDYEIGRSVFALQEPDGQVPSSLSFTPAYASKAGPAKKDRMSHRSGAPYSRDDSTGATASSSGAGGTGRGGFRGAGGSNNSRFGCLVCGEKGHDLAACTKIPSNLTVEG